MDHKLIRDVSPTDSQRNVFRKELADCIILTKNNTLYLQMRPRNPEEIGKISLFGGHVEEGETPLQAVIREIQEETTLDSSCIRLFRQGKPYTFRDESVGREWTINPFGFTLLLDSDAADAAIKLDYEHESYAWFELDELLVSDDDYADGVPKLLQSLRRVWFEADLGADAGRIMRDGLRELQEDHESGARVLASKALAVFKEAIAELQRGGCEQWGWKVRITGWHLWKNGRESMGASVLSVVLSSLAIIEGYLPDQSTEISSDVVQRCVNKIAAFEDQRQTASVSMGLQFTGFINDHFLADDSQQPLRILTLSCSSTITQCLNTLASKTTRPIEIRILESRPLFEGVTMAQRLTPTDLCKISLYTDASAAIASRDIHLALIGADLIDAAGNVSNKTGSLPAVLSARHVSPSAKVVAVAEREKVLPFEPPAHEEENDPREVTGSWGNAGAAAAAAAAANVDVRNVYFEWVPASMVHHYVTENGVLTGRDVERLAEDGRARAGIYFDSI